MTLTVTPTQLEGVQGLSLSCDEGASSVDVFAELGGLFRFRLGGRDWLCRNPTLSLEGRRTGAAMRPPLSQAYVGAHSDNVGGDVGLGDFMLGTCKSRALSLEGGREAFLPDHGLVWALRPKVTVTGRQRSLALLTVWTETSAPLPFVLTRRMSLDTDRLRLDYVLENAGRGAFPNYWSTHDLFPVSEGTRCFLNRGTAFTVDTAIGIDVIPGVHRWPFLTLTDGQRVNLSHPTVARDTLGRGFAVKLFTAKPHSKLRLESEGQQLEIAAKAKPRRPFVGWWINVQGWVPQGRAGFAAPYQNMCPEFSSAQTDDACLALERGDITWLAPGDQSRWTVTYRVVTPGAERAMTRETAAPTARRPRQSRRRVAT